MRRLALLLALVLAPAAHAQSTPSPEAVAQAMYETMRAGDFEAAATLAHPDALREIQDFGLMVLERDSSGMFASMFFGEASAEAVRALTPVQLYARLIGATTRLQPGVAEALRTMQAQTLGAVPEGDSVAHVVQRTQITMEGLTMTKMQVVSLKRDGEAWRTLLSGDLSALTQALRARFEALDEGGGEQRP